MLLPVRAAEVFLTALDVRPPGWGQENPLAFRLLAVGTLFAAALAVLYFLRRSRKP
jgi:hypothetical protein